MKQLLTISLSFLALSVSVYGQGACNNQTSVTHQGYEYDIIEIGDQCWFAENCRYLPSISPVSQGNAFVPYYYVGGYFGTDLATAQADSIYETYGALYNWPAVMTEDICPSGWHIPSDREWMTLEMYLGMSEEEANNSAWRGTDEGNKMKSVYGWYDGCNGSNSSGFNGLPGYSRSCDGGYVGDACYWWSSSAQGDSIAWMRRLSPYDSFIYSLDEPTCKAMSARCVRD